MAAIGAKYPCFAPFAQPETEYAPPTYAGGVVIGEMVTGSMTPNMASAEAWADDMLIESVNEVGSATIALETLDILDDVASVVYGAEVSDGEVRYGKDDSPPYGGLAYYKRLLRHGEEYFQAFFFPKAKAAIGADNAATKSASVTFQNKTTTFTASQPFCIDTKWMIQKTFKQEKDAREWVREKLGMDANVSVVKSVSIAGTAEVGQELTANVVYDIVPSNTPTLTYKWQRSADDLTYEDAGTEEKYTVAVGDETKYIRCVVTAVTGATGGATSAGVLISA